MDNTIKNFCDHLGITFDEFSGLKEIKHGIEVVDDIFIPQGFSPIIWGDLKMDKVVSLPDNFNPTIHGNVFLKSVKVIPNKFEPIISGDLYMNSVKEIPEDFNPIMPNGGIYLMGVSKINGSLPITVGSLDLSSLIVLPEVFNPKVDSYLDLSSVKEINKGFCPKVSFALFLSSIEKLPIGFDLEIEGSLIMDSIKTLPKDFKPIVGMDLKLNSLREIPKGFKPIVGCNLHLNSIKKVPSWFNPVVGYSLQLKGLEKLPKGFNPTIGKSLYLSKIKNIPDYFNPKLGAYLFVGTCNNPTYLIDSERLHSIIFRNGLSWENGKYISVDGIFCEVVNKKGNYYKCKYLHSEKEFYVVTDGNNNYAHGNTLKEAQLDLSFKLSKRNIDGYKNLTLDSVLKHDEAVICYRVITGACSFGTNDFLNNVLGDNTKESYTIREIIQLTENQYGNITFKDFFNV